MIHKPVFEKGDGSDDSFSIGDPLEFLLREVESYKTSYTVRAIKEFEKQLDVTISSETKNILRVMHRSQKPRKLLQTIKDIDIESAAGYELSDLDEELEFAHAPRNIDVEEVKYRKNRDTVYVPKLHVTSGDGEVYMAKSISSLKKVEMAWDLHEDNEIVVVDDYDKWENLLGWSKLKDLPHNTNSIREEYGDRLSDEVLDSVTKDKSEKRSKTQTQPSEEMITVSTTTRSYGRQSISAESIKEQFKKHGSLFSKNVKKLVLFPTTSDYNLSENRWITGSFPGVGKVAVGNCNKGTFEYLNQCEEVYHIRDYLKQSMQYTFETDGGTECIDSVDSSNLVFHLMSDEMKNILDEQGATEDMKEELQPFADNHSVLSADLPDPEEMVYVPLSPESVFWLAPALQTNSDVFDKSISVVVSDVSHQNLSVDVAGNAYKLYARARLTDWDFDSEEMSLLDECSRSIDLDEGGLELVETLAKLHDRGMKPYSEQKTLF